MARKAESPLRALQLSLGHVRLQVEQAQALVAELRRDMADEVQILAEILPFMMSPAHAQVLVSLYLGDDYARRGRLEDRLGPAYLCIMGIFTGHYNLDLQKEVRYEPTHHLATATNLPTAQVALPKMHRPPSSPPLHLPRRTGSP